MDLIPPRYPVFEVVPEPAIAVPDDGYPTIERLADISRGTVGYQSHELIAEAVRCWRENASLRRQNAELRRRHLDTRRNSRMSSQGS